MEKDSEKRNQKKNGLKTRGITQTIDTSLLHWAEHITTIDLSNKHISFFNENTNLPANLYDLNLSNNSLSEVPAAVLNLQNLKFLNLSYNNIVYFDDTPKFCRTIETLDLSYNHLAGPPYWVWSESPQKLSVLNLYYNINLTKALNNIYFEELLQYPTPMLDVNISICRLRDHKSLLGTFVKVKTLELGSTTFSGFANNLEEIPFIGLDKCCDIERLNLCNTQIYNVKTNIDMFKNIVEINLSHNFIRDLPREFCNLENLEICLLSSNDLLYLPDDIYKLKKLTRLHLDNNEICMLPEGISELKNLEFLDLYSNGLYEIPVLMNIKELDLAQNYFDEPEDSEYLEKKEKFRINLHTRYDGRRVEPARPASEDSTRSIDEEFLNSEKYNEALPSQPPDPPSSPEDWDSDDYWMPSNLQRVRSSPQSSWIFFVKQKMAEGNFCPMDVHTVPIAEQVKYEKICNPKEWCEVEGQFDDLTDDSS